MTEFLALFQFCALGKYLTRLSPLGPALLLRVMWKTLHNYTGTVLSRARGT